MQVECAASPEALDVFEAHGCVAAPELGLPIRYVMPVVANPYGAMMSAEERSSCLEADAILEDESYSELLFDGPAPRPLLADAPDRVFSIGDFVASIAPAVRIGWLIAPRSARSRVREAKQRRQDDPSQVLQSVVEQLLASPSYDVRLARVRERYRERGERMMAAMTQVPGVRFRMPAGGLWIWVETNFSGNDNAWLRFALEHGVAFDPGDLFRPHSLRLTTVAMRLSFSSIPVELIEPGIDRLAETLRQAQAMRGRAAA